MSYKAGPQSVRDDRAKTLLLENKLIEDLTKKAKQKGLEATGLLIQGATVSLIIEECDKLQADLLIIGHKKQGFLQRILKGSVAGGILENTNIPLLVIPLAD